MEENKVSIWIGKLENSEIFNEYITESYDDDGNMSSHFMKDFNIDYYDAQFREALFGTSGDKMQVFKNFSYIENFFEKLPFHDFIDFNSFILIYNFNYSYDILKAGAFKYIGIFDYR